MAKVVSQFLTEAGFDVTLEEVEPGRCNVIARCPGPADRPRIFFGPHLDTVSVKGMTIEPFSGEIRDGKLWGRGASDTKGPMAAMLMALKNCADHLKTSAVAADFVGFVSEETDQAGAKHFAKNHADEYDFAVVGEPTSLQVVNVTKGCLWAQLDATGIATHASQPHLGENAVLKLCSALTALQAQFAPQLAEFTHPVLGATSLNIATMQGGTLPNIVPAAASARLDIRFTPSLHDAGGPFAQLEKFLHDYPLDISAKSLTCNPPMEVAADHPMITKLCAAGPATSCTGAPWFSDAAHLNAGGIPAICIGPGSIDQAHTCDEFIQLDDLEDGLTFFEKFIRSL